MKQQLKEEKLPKQRKQNMTILNDMIVLALYWN